MPDPIALGIDTSAAHCAAALLCGDALLTLRHEEMAKGQAERLMPMLQEMLAEAGLGWRDLAVIGVGTGPGNFTGIRVAVAAARALALALQVPAVGVSVPEALALDLPRPCRIVIPGRRGSVIWQDFGVRDRDDRGVDGQAGDHPRQAEDGALPPGPKAAVPLHPLPVAIARIALARRRSPGPRPAPLYLRPADAAPARDPAPIILP